MTIPALASGWQCAHDGNYLAAGKAFQKVAKETKSLETRLYATLSMGFCCEMLDHPHQALLVFNHVIKFAGSDNTLKGLALTGRALGLSSRGAVKDFQEARSLLPEGLHSFVDDAAKHYVAKRALQAQMTEASQRMKRKAEEYLNDHLAN